VVALVLARLDYCNGVLAGLPASQLRRLQSVLHAAARLIYGVRQYIIIIIIIETFVTRLLQLKNEHKRYICYIKIDKNR